MREIMTDVVTTILLAVITMGITVACDTVRKAGTRWLEKVRDDAEKKNLEVSASMFETANKLLASITYNAVGSYGARLRPARSVRRSSGTGRQKPADDPGEGCAV